MTGYFQDDAVRKPMTYRQLFRHLWPYFMQHKVSFSIVVASMVGLAVIGRILPFLFGYAIDHGIGEKNHHLIGKLALIYLVLEIGRAYLTFLHSYLFIKMGNQILSQIRERLIRHVQALPIPYFDRTPTGRIVTRVTNDVLALGELFTEGLIMVITNALSLVAIVVALLWISPYLTVVSLAVAPVMVWVALLLSNRVQAILRESKKKVALINAFVAESLNGIKVLQLHNRTRHRATRFGSYSAEYMNLQLKSVTIYALLWPAVSFFFAVSLASALYFGGFLHHDGSLAIGALIAFLMNVQDFFPPLRSILEKYQQFQNSLTGAERVFSLLQESAEMNDKEMRQIPQMQRPRLHGHLEFHDVSFRYNDDLPLVLNRLNLQILPGQSLAIVGRTGSGKTTIISLLQRLYESWHGQILMDGQDLLSFDRRELRSRIGVVQQDNFIFRGTIEQNISLFNPAITSDRIIRAIQLSSCEGLVQRHGGLSGMLEERGANLSSGERQLIAFARVLAFDPDVLILDEATANIDSESESFIQKATREATRGRTSIIIAHRLSTILQCDQILVLDHGELREIGTHSELIARGGAYFQLYQSQFRETSSPSPLIPTDS